MSDEASDDDFRREGRQISVTLSEEWIRDNLFPAYKHCTTLSQAVRAAVKDGVEAKEDQPPSISQQVLQEVIEAMRSEGGEVEQTVRIGSVGEIDIESADDVDIDEERDGSEN